MQLGAADGGDQRVAGRRGGRLDPGAAVAGRLGRALIARGGEERDALRRGVREHLVLLYEQVRIHAGLGLAEALGDDVAEVVIHRVLRGAQDVGIIVRLGQVEHDVRAGGDGMRPQDVQRDLLRPPGHVRITGDERRQAIRGDLGERAEARVGRVAQPVQTRQAVEGVEVVQLLHDVRRLERVDDDDRLALAVEAGVDQRVNAVGVPHLIRVIAGPDREADLAAEQAVAGTGNVGWDGLRTQHEGWRCGRG